jgi:uncharacterized membrane protein YjdF
MMNNLVKRFEAEIIICLLVGGTIFLLELAYLRIWVSTPICAAYLAAIYGFVKMRYQIKIPILLLFLVFLSVALDGLGNLFGLYTTRYKYIQYDEFTHTAIPALTSPIIVWLLYTLMNNRGYRLPLGLVTFFSITTIFTIAGFYEVIELYDDKYMWPQPGMRIHGSYDTANDLQCDLIGMISGGLIAFSILKRREKETEQTLRTASAHL